MRTPPKKKKDREAKGENHVLGSRIIDLKHREKGGVGYSGITEKTGGGEKKEEKSCAGHQTTAPGTKKLVRNFGEKMNSRTGE